MPLRRKTEKSILFSQGVLKVRKRVTKVVLAVSAIYGLCWLPNLTVYALAYLSPSQKYGSVLYITSIVLVTCNSTVNPFIYVFVNKKFREKVKSLLFCGKTCSGIVNPRPIPVAQVGNVLMPLTASLTPPWQTTSVT